MSQNELERRCGIAIGQISRIEGGYRGAELPIDTVVALAQVLGLTLDQLVFGPEPGGFVTGVRCAVCLDVPRRRQGAGTKKRPRCAGCGRPWSSKD